MEWQPIETAPRFKEKAYKNAFLGWDGYDIEKTWEGWEENGKPVYVYADWSMWNPTHWMPLPAAPT